MKSETLKPPKKVVTITVVGCEDLKLPYDGVRDVAPFFFYQFYTFDDRYSKNGFGLAPRFNDTFSYEVLFDARAHSFFEKEHLEIILFDDNAPITGKGLDGQAGQNDDMIGVASIPLRMISQGASIHEKFPLTAPKTKLQVGTIEIKLSVQDYNSI